MSLLLSLTATASSSSLNISTDTVRSIIDVLTPLAFNALGALLVLLIGLWIAGRIKNLFKHALAKSERIDDTLETFLVSLVHYALIAIVIITTLGVFGVPTTSFAAILGAAGLAIGLALQGTLGHIASGVMLLAFRPFDVEDFVEMAGHSGTVKKLTLFTTEMATPDNKMIIIPNGEIWSGSIVNYSAYGERRIDLVFNVSYDDDLDTAMSVIRAVIDQETRLLPERETKIAVDALADHSVDIVCRPWVKSSDYLAVKWALVQAIKEAFDRESITIPYPTTTQINIKQSDEQ